MLETIQQSMLKIEDMMTSEVITISAESTMKQAKEVMRQNNVNALPVTDDAKKLIGIITVADVIRVLDCQKINEIVKNEMTKKVFTLNPKDSLNAALNIFRRYQFNSLPVINNDKKVVGIITPNDIVKGLAEYLKLDEINLPEEKKLSGFEKGRELIYQIDGGDFSKAGLAASGLKKALLELKINSDIVRRTAIVAYEAEMNIVIHAYGGSLRAEITKEKIIVDVKDNGPGIKDLDQAMKIGFSTASDRIRELGFGAGMGLPNIKKSSDLFELKSVPEKGTELHIEIFLEEGRL